MKPSYPQVDVFILTIINFRIVSRRIIIRVRQLTSDRWEVDMREDYELEEETRRLQYFVATMSAVVIVLYGFGAMF